MFKFTKNQEEKPIKSYADFWNWFKTHEKEFYKTVKSGKNIEEKFFDQLSPKLNQLIEGLYFTTGMSDENTAELIITADGIVKNIVFAEELIKAAPTLPHWKFTALKPAHSIENVRIEMGDYFFEKENLFFYAIDHPDYPDMVDIVFVHHDYNEENTDVISNGTLIFIDHFLGELNFITLIDHFSLVSKQEATHELIPIEKLKSYLIWREKEFIEKYNTIDLDKNAITFSQMSTTLNNGKPLLAIIGTSLLDWEYKASHPWMLYLDLTYDGNENGMPDQETLDQIYRLEDEISKKLEATNQTIYLGRETADNLRTSFFACQDFREPSKIVYEFQKNYSGTMKLTYEIGNDKYWRSLEKYHIQ